MAILAFELLFAMSEGDFERAFSRFQSNRFPSGFFEYFAKYKYKTSWDTDVSCRNPKRIKYEIKPLTSQTSSKFFIAHSALKQDAFDQLISDEKQTSETE